MSAFFGKLVGLRLRHWLRGFVDISVCGDLMFDDRGLAIAGAPELALWAGWKVVSIEYRRPTQRADEFTRVDGRPSMHIFAKQPRLKLAGQILRLIGVRMSLDGLGQPVEMVS